MAGIAARLRAIVDEYGAESVAMYTGNPLAFNALGQPATAALARGLGVRRVFSSGTQDCANKFTASEAIYGSSTIHPIPDLARTDFCIVIGSNPRVSQGSFIAIPNFVKEMKRGVARGARFTFVNPRRVETPDMGVGDTVLIKPDTDVYFLASLLHELQAMNAFDEGPLSRHGTHVDGLKDFIARYDAETTAPVTGIPADTVHRPRRRTRKPRIDGVETAVVTGTSGEEVEVDAHGRIKVQFHWDRENPADETSSCWIRVTPSTRSASPSAYDSRR